MKPLSSLTDETTSGDALTGGQSGSVLRVAMATPLGKGGNGGMDRLVDRVIERVNPTSLDDVAVCRLTTKGGGSKFVGAFYFAFAVLCLAAKGVLGRLDLVHLNLAAYGSFHRKRILAAITGFFGIPYVVHIHSGRFIEFWDEAGTGRERAINQFMRNSSQIIVLGQIYRELVERHAPDCLHKVKVMANATPERPAKLATLEDVKCPLEIVFLGVLTPLKGVPQLLEALANLKDRPDWKATLAGSDKSNETRDRVRELGLQDRVFLPGWVTPDQVDTLLSGSDFLVLASFTEGQPMSIIEAFSWGKPVVATPINAIVDVVRHEQNGLFVEPGDVEGLTVALKRLLDDHELRLRLGATALADHRAHYSTASYVKRLTALWREAGAKGSKSSVRAQGLHRR